MCHNVADDNCVFGIEVVTSLGLVSFPDILGCILMWVSALVICLQDNIPALVITTKDISRQNNFLNAIFLLFSNDYKFLRHYCQLWMWSKE
jgi:hypothetical protein